MFAPQPELAAKEMIRVTKRGGKSGCSSWPPELANGSIFRTNIKYLLKNSQAPPSPILYGVPEIIEKRMEGVSNIYFDRGTTIHSILSPNHFWEHMSKKIWTIIESYSNFGQSKQY